jgi:hypothetical protein
MAMADVDHHRRGVAVGQDGILSHGDLNVLATRWDEGYLVWLNDGRARLIKKEADTLAPKSIT